MPEQGLRSVSLHCIIPDERNELIGESSAFLVTGNQSFQETASSMEAFQRIKELLDRLVQPVVPYETEQAAADRSSQEQV